MEANKDFRAIPSLTNVILEKETEALKFLGIVLWIFFALVPLEHAVESVLEKYVEIPKRLMCWQVVGIEGVLFLAAVYVTLSIRYRKGVRLGKYILLVLLNAIPTLAVYWIGHIWIALAYIPVMMLSCLFYDWRLPIVTGIVSLFSFFLTPTAPSFWLPRAYFLTGFFVLTAIVAVLIIKRNYVFVRGLVERTEELQKAKQELEDAKISLEIRVKARTRELSELAQSLEEQVKERTKELQKRLDELEKFRRLTVGRELKMIELKKRNREIEKNNQERKVKVSNRINNYCLAPMLSGKILNKHFSGLKFLFEPAVNKEKSKNPGREDFFE